LDVLSLSAKRIHEQNSSWLSFAILHSHIQWRCRNIHCGKVSWVGDLTTSAARLSACTEPYHAAASVIGQSQSAPDHWRSPPPHCDSYDVVVGPTLSAMAQSLQPSLPYGFARLNAPTAKHYNHIRSSEDVIVRRWNQPRTCKKTVLRRTHSMKWWLLNFSYSSLEQAPWWYKVKGAIHHKAGCSQSVHLPLCGHWARRWIDHRVREAWSVQSRRLDEEKVEIQENSFVIDEGRQKESSDSLWWKVFVNKNQSSGMHLRYVGVAATCTANHKFIKWQT